MVSEASGNSQGSVSPSLAVVEEAKHFMVNIAQCFDAFFSESSDEFSAQPTVAQLIDDLIRSKRLAFEVTNSDEMSLNKKRPNSAEMSPNRKRTKQGEHLWEPALTDAPAPEVAEVAAPPASVDGSEPALTDAPALEVAEVATLPAGVEGSEPALTDAPAPAVAEVAAPPASVKGSEPALTDAPALEVAEVTTLPAGVEGSEPALTDPPAPAVAEVAAPPASVNGSEPALTDPPAPEAENETTDPTVQDQMPARQSGTSSPYLPEVGNGNILTQLITHSSSVKDVRPLDKNAKNKLYGKIGSESQQITYSSITQGVCLDEFTVRCMIRDDVIGVGVDRTFRKASSRAAMDALRNREKIKFYAKKRKQRRALSIL